METEQHRAIATSNCRGDMNTKMMHSNLLDRLEARLSPHREGLLAHPIYPEIDRLAALQTFLEFHVFAVWDFMSLLKALQRRLCCVEVPWLPPPDSRVCRMINEIVLGEESDDDGRGGFASHFELYYRAMQRCGANTMGIDSLLRELRRGCSVQAALAAPHVPPAVRPFVTHTFDIIESGDLIAMAAAFTFGRENLLPAVFQQIVNELHAEVGSPLDDFRYYLNRHIGLDGDEHGPLATQLVQSLCGQDERLWNLAADTAEGCLLARRQLWDGIYAAMREPREPSSTDDSPSDRCEPGNFSLSR